MSYLRKERLHFHLQEILAVAQFVGASTALYFILVNRPTAVKQQRFTVANSLAFDERTTVVADVAAPASAAVVNATAPLR